MKLLGAPLSPFVRKARIVAAEKGLEYEYDPRPGPSPRGWAEGYETINPFMRIPALLPDPSREDFAIIDSSAICGYFERLQPAPQLYPADPAEFGRALWIEELSDTDLAAKIGLGVFRPVFFNLFAGKPADYDAADEGFAGLEKKLLPYLEHALEISSAAGSGSEYFAGDTFSIADISIASQFMNLQHAGYIVPASKYPMLAAHLQKQYLRPTIATFIDGDQKFLTEKMNLDLPVRNA